MPKVNCKTECYTSPLHIAVWHFKISQADREFLEVGSNPTLSASIQERSP